MSVVLGRAAALCTLLCTLLVTGCSCSDQPEPLTDGSVPLDGGEATLADGDVVLDGGTADCAEYARVLCASANECYLETIWVFGSIERCEAHIRGECEYERSLPGVAPSRTDALLDCYEEDVACDLWRGDRDCALPAGSRTAGEPCRWGVQCAEGLICAGGSDGARASCDTGMCRAPLSEGATDCWNRDDGNRCALGLRCAREDDTSECVPYVLPGAGERCLDTSECGAGLYCDTTVWTCEPQLGNGAPCDPTQRVDGIIGPCGGAPTFECDAATRTCVQVDRAFVGEACSDEGATCLGPCVDGVCTSAWAASGEPCDASFECGSYACVDGVCAPAPCD